MLERYPWSTFRGYLGVSWRKPWVNYDEVLAQTGGSSRKYRAFLQDAIGQGYATPWEKLKARVVLANDEFVAKLSKSLGGGGSLREQPSAKAIEKLTAEQVLRTVGRYPKIKPEELARRRTPFRDYRAMAMELMSTPWTVPLINLLSRKHEYEADCFAALTLRDGKPMEEALVNLTIKNLSNLTPHPWYSAYHYSHPTRTERIEAIRQCAA